MNDEATIRVHPKQVPFVARQTLLEMHRCGGGSPAMREAGRLLAERGAGARLTLLCTLQQDLGADKRRIDDYLERAGLIDIDGGPLSEEP